MQPTGLPPTPDHRRWHQKHRGLTAAIAVIVVVAVAAVAVFVVNLLPPRISISTTHVVWSACTTTFFGPERVAWVNFVLTNSGYRDAYVWWQISFDLAITGGARVLVPGQHSVPMNLTTSVSGCADHTIVVTVAQVQTA